MRRFIGAPILRPFCSCLRRWRRVTSVGEPNVNLQYPTRGRAGLGLLPLLFAFLAGPLSLWRVVDDFKEVPQSDIEGAAENLNPRDGSVIAAPACDGPERVRGYPSHFAQLAATEAAVTSSLVGQHRLFKLDDNHFCTGIKRKMSEYDKKMLTYDIRGVQYH